MDEIESLRGLLIATIVSMGPSALVGAGRDMLGSRDPIVRAAMAARKRAPKSDETSHYLSKDKKQE